MALTTVPCGTALARDYAGYIRISCIMKSKKNQTVCFLKSKVQKCSVLAYRICRRITTKIISQCAVYENSHWSKPAV
jgi:hypothetical protein